MYYCSFDDAFGNIGKVIAFFIVGVSMFFSL